MDYATIDAEGVITGLFPEKVFPTPPIGAIPMTPEEYATACSGGLVRDIPGERWMAKPTPIRTATQARAEKLAALAAHRYAVETGGIVVGGLSVVTDRESQAMVNGTYSSLKDGLILDTEWKGVNGWMVVTLAEIQPIAQAVAMHVRACFANERAHTIAINILPDDVARIDNYDITTGW